VGRASEHHIRKTAAVDERKNYPPEGDDDGKRNESTWRQPREHTNARPTRRKCTKAVAAAGEMAEMWRVGVAWRGLLTR
jgi:hypothetical protein